MYYHASQTGGLKKLIPHVSNHNISWLYLSEKRENILVYLSNAVEKYCKENDFKYDGIWSTWASYGFDKDGMLQIEEYYPNATYEVYKGVSGYIYKVKDIKDSKKLSDIPYVFVTAKSQDVYDCEFISDAYDEIMKAVDENKIKILKYEDIDDKKRQWIKDIILKEYNDAENHPEYRFFLLNKFDFLDELIKNNNIKE